MPQTHSYRDCLLSFSGTFLTQICCSTFSSLSLSDVEEKCKQAAALKLPLSRLEVNTEEARVLFQVSSTQKDAESLSCFVSHPFFVCFGKLVIVN